MSIAPYIFKKEKKMKYKINDLVEITVHHPHESGLEKGERVRVIGVEEITGGQRLRTHEWCFHDNECRLIERKADMQKSDLKDEDRLSWSDGDVSIYKGLLFGGNGLRVIRVDRDGETIWKEEVKKMTVKEVCDALGYEVEIVK